MHFWFVILCFCLFFSGCKKREEDPKPGAAMMLPCVTVYDIQPQDLVQDQTFVGETQSFCVVQIRGRVEGILLKRHFQEGQSVSKGDMLFTIDPRPFIAKLDRVKARLAENRATFINAAKNHRRLQALVKEKAVSQKEADEAQAAVLVAEANVLSAKARVTEASLDLEYTQIASPISGITSAFLKNQGDLVIPGTGDSSLLTQVTQMDPIYVNFYVTDKQMQASGDLFRKRGEEEVPLKAKLLLSDDSAYEEEGVITFMDPLMRQESGTFLMRATFPNPKHILKPGQFVTLKLQVPPVKNALVIPQRCVIQKDDKQLAFVVKADGSVTPRPIQGKQIQSNLFWVKAGLHPGEQIVLDGLMKVKPGGRVTVMPQQAPHSQQTSP